MTDWSRFVKCWECGAERARPCVTDDDVEADKPCEGRVAVARVVSIDVDIRRLTQWQHERPSVVLALIRLVRGERFGVPVSTTKDLLRFGYATMVDERIAATSKGRDAVTKWNARPVGVR